MEKKRQITASGYQWRGRIWLEGVEGTFLGYGRVILLERIREYGSLSQAAKSMEMSYKHAWDLLGSMNRQAGCPLVAMTRGGKSGGGASLTAAGERAIILFHECHERFERLLQEMSAGLEEVSCAEGLQERAEKETAQVNRQKAEG